MADTKPNNPDTTKRFLPLWFVLLMLVLIGFTLFGEKGLLRVVQSYRHRAALEEKIAEMEKTNAELRREIEALRNDLKTIENLARRELGMVREDEQIYQFPPEDEQHPALFRPEGENDPVQDEPRLDTGRDGG